MLNPLVHLLGSIIHLYMLCVISWAILSTLISFKMVNAYHPWVRKIAYALERLVGPPLKTIRKYLPDLGGIDISPILLLLALQFLQDSLYTYFYRF